jgi:hypothetical protein
MDRVTYIEDRTKVANLRVVQVVSITRLIEQQRADGVLIGPFVLTLRLANRSGSFAQDVPIWISGCCMARPKPAVASALFGQLSSTRADILL